MRRTCFGVVASFVLAGSFTDTANSQTAAPVQKPVPAALAKDCAERVLKDSPTTKFVGPFAQLTYANRITQWVAEGRVIAIAAPTRMLNPWGHIVRHSMGCRYDMENGKPVFYHIIPEINLPRRRLLPGEK